MLDQFRRFRRTRPFWAGLFTILGGIEILLLPLSPVSDMVLLGVAGMSGALIGVLLVITGLFVWFSPPNRTLAGVLTLVFSLASFVVSNLGGLIVGMVLGLIGGGLTLAWTPDRTRHVGRTRRGGRGGDGPPAGGTVASLVVLLVLGLPAGQMPASQPGPAVGAAVGLGAVGQSAAGPVAVGPATVGLAADAHTIGPLPIPPPPLPHPPGSGGAAGPPGIPVPRMSSPGARGPLLPPVLPGLTNLLPAALFAPFQPTVTPERDAVASGLVGELLMDSLTVTNFRYQGMVDFPVAGGGRQRAMRIIVDSTDIGNLRINIPGKDASVQVTQRADAKHASTTRLVLDCTRLRVTIAGLLTVEFTLDFPPPPLVVIPYLPVTDVQIDYVRLSTPTLIIPGLFKKAAGPTGKRVGFSGPGAGSSRSRAGQPLTPDQISQLTRMAALLRSPRLLNPYGAARL
jgi:hypothetical protein